MMSMDVNIGNSQELLCPKLHNFIKEVALKKNIKEFVYHVDNVCQHGDNYVANLFRIIINYENEENEDLRLIVKTLVNTGKEEIFSELHKREVYAYNHVLPKLLAIQDNVTSLRIPKCYIANADPDNQVVILEDFKAKNFLMVDKFDRMNYPTAELVVKNLASFHSKSFVLEKLDPKAFNEIKNNCRNIIYGSYFLEKCSFRQYFEESFETSVSVVSDDIIRGKLEDLAPEIVDIMKNLSLCDNYNVICHGDSWVNNFLFKFEDSRPIEMCFLDFQAMAYASPVNDIFYFIYLCTDSSFRSDCFEELLNVYYETLTKSLEIHNINVNTVYPKEVFFNQLKRLRIWAFIAAMIEIKLLTVKAEDEDDLINLNTPNEDEYIEMPESLRNYADRVNDLVEEFVYAGLLEDCNLLVGIQGR